MAEVVASDNYRFRHRHFQLQVSSNAFNIFTAGRPDPKASESGLYFAWYRETFDGLAKAGQPGLA